MLAFMGVIFLLCPKQESSHEKSLLFICLNKNVLEFCLHEVARFEYVGKVLHNLLCNFLQFGLDCHSLHEVKSTSI